MIQKSHKNKFRVGAPLRYRISVQGHFDTNSFSLTDGMEIESRKTIGKNKVTTLVGYFADQAALTGLLKEICDNRIPLLAVENLDDKGRSKNEKFTG